MYKFRGRHLKISLCSPPKYNLAPLLALMETNVGPFYINLKTILERHPTILKTCRICNLDESGLITVMSKPEKVFVKKGDCIVLPTAAERGSTVTICVNICANDSYDFSPCEFSKSYAHWCLSRYSRTGLYHWLDEESSICGSFAAFS